MPYKTNTSILDKIISIIEEHGKLSRQKVKDILKTEYNSKNITLINKALEDGVQTGKLIKKGQTFSLKGRSKNTPDEEPEEEEEKFKDYREIWMKNLGYKSPNKDQGKLEIYGNKWRESDAFDQE